MKKVKRTDAEQEVCDRAYEDAAKFGKSRAGMSHLKKYLAGGKLTPIQAIHARCVQCLGLGEETMCASIDCPLHPFQVESRDG